jgi:anti-sigma B factor antagonist
LYFNGLPTDFVDLALPEREAREACMSLSIEIRKVDHITILDLAGRVSVLETRLKETAWELIERGERYFLINLANVSYLDNSGLGQLCWIYTIARNRGGDMKLLNATPRIKTLLSITKLDSVLQSFDREKDAIASMPLLTTFLLV